MLCGGVVVGIGVLTELMQTPHVIGVVSLLEQSLNGAGAGSCGSPFLLTLLYFRSSAGLQAIRLYADRCHHCL